ncbi:MAG: ATP-binding cassette domain-containing protein [Candidatus Heimdallarchaeaceae archaeon]
MNSETLAIETSRLTKDYDSLRAVNEVDLKITRSEIFGLLGPNGAGKTTTIRLLAGILTPTFGDAKVIGLDTVEQSLELREKVGLLTETPSIYERLTVRQNLSFFAQIYGVKKEDIELKIDQLADIFEITEKLDVPAGTLSKGMKQKLAIARAMIHDPEVLFLDEPTASLAPESAKVVHDLIHKLAKERKRTFFIATHNLTEAERLCDRVAIINKGKLLAVGAPNELKSMMKGETITIIRFLKWDKEIEKFFEDTSYNVRNIDTDNRIIKLKLDEYEKQTPKILKDLISKNFQITEIYHQKPSLEKIYLELVEGEEENKGRGA